MGLPSQGVIKRGRQPEIDCLKAFCIAPMILLHAYEECAEAPAGFYYVLQFIESISGAGAFMLCMGLVIRYSRKQSPRDLAERGLELLTISQLLNLLRDSIPDLIAWWCTGEKVFLSASLLVLQTDILTFAGLAFLLMALLRHLKLSDGAICGLGFCMNAFAFALSFVFRTTGHFLLDQILGFFVVTDAESYFPLCSYFFFVAFGMALGAKYREIGDKDSFFNRILLVGLPAAILYYILRMNAALPLLPEFFSTERYVMMPVTDALVNCLSALCLLGLFHKLLRLRNGRLPAMVAHLSRHINQYYCISFVLTTPFGTMLMALRGEGIPGSLLPLLYGIFVLIATYWIIEWNEKHLHFGIANLRNPKRRIVFAAIWLLSAAVILYAYPQVQEYATVWNDYLM